MFEGDPHDRAKDRDRDRATYVIDAALRAGQITQQDRDLRVERVRSSATVGELASLTRDIAAPPVPLPPTAVVPPPVVSTSSTTSSVPTAPPADPYGPGSTRPVAGVPSDLYGPPPSKAKKKPVASGTGLTVKPAAGRKVAMGCALVVALFFIVPIAAGIVIFTSTADDGNGFGLPVESETPVPEPGPPFELDAAGIREYVGAFGDTFGQTEVVRTVFYDGYVVSWVPQGDGISIVNYANGVFNYFGDPMTDTEDTAPVDLAALRPGRVMALVRQAEQFGLQGEVTTYVIYDRDVIEGSPHVMVYVSNDQGESGYVIGDLDGKVLTRSEPS